MLANLLDKRITSIYINIHTQNLGINSPNKLEVYAATCELNDNILLIQVEMADIYNHFFT